MQRNWLLAVTFIDLLGFGLLLPIMPFIGLELKASALEIGLLAAIFPLGQILFLPFWGHAADRFGASRVLTISLAGAAAAYFLFAVAHSYSLLLLSRGLAGITSATLGVARGSLVDLQDNERHQKNLRWFGAAQGFGFLLGPVMGTGLALISNRAPMFLASFLCAIAAMGLMFQHWPHQTPTQMTTWREKTQLLSKNPSLRHWAEIFFLVTMAFAFLFIAFPLFLHDAYAFESRATGLYFSLLAISAVLAQIVILPRWQKLQSDQMILRISGLLLAAGDFSLVLARTPWITALILVITAIALFAILQISMSRYGSASPESEKNLAAGLSESLGGIARLAGTLISGWLIDHSGLLAAFATSATIVIVALLRSWKISD